MAGKGNTIPKDTGARRRQNASPPTRVVVADNNLRGPDLPFGFDWPSQTREWWETWRRSPQAQTMTDTDWSFLLDTAMLHAEFWAGNLAVGAELRLRVAKFGATPEDRARLRLEIEEPKPAPERDKPPRGYGGLRALDSA